MVTNLPASATDVRDAGSVPGLGKSPGGGHGYPLQYSCLERPMDRGACWVTVHSIVRSRTRLKRLSSQTGSELKRPSGPASILVLKPRPPLPPWGHSLKGYIIPTLTSWVRTQVTGTSQQGRLQEGHHFCVFLFVFVEAKST